MYMPPEVSKFTEQCHLEAFVRCLHDFLDLVFRFVALIVVPRECPNISLHAEAADEFLVALPPVRCIIGTVQHDSFRLDWIYRLRHIIIISLCRHHALVDIVSGISSRRHNITPADNALLNNAPLEMSRQPPADVIPVAVLAGHHRQRRCALRVVRQTLGTMQQSTARL